VVIANVPFLVSITLDTFSVVELAFLVQYVGVSEKSWVRRKL